MTITLTQEEMRTIVSALDARFDDLEAKGKAEKAAQVWALVEKLDKARAEIMIWQGGAAQAPQKGQDNERIYNDR